MIGIKGVDIGRYAAFGLLRKVGRGVQDSHKGFGESSRHLGELIDWKLREFAQRDDFHAPAQVRPAAQVAVVQILKEDQSLQSPADDRPDAPSTVPSLARVQWERMQRVMADYSGNILTGCAAAGDSSPLPAA